MSNTPYYTYIAQGPRTDKDDAPVQQDQFVMVHDNPRSYCLYCGLPNTSDFMLIVFFQQTNNTCIIVSLEGMPVQNQVQVPQL